MTTVWVLLTMIGTTLPVQDSYHIYPTQEACQAQIDSLPEQKRRTIAGDLFHCVPIYFNGISR